MAALGSENHVMSSAYVTVTTFRKFPFQPSIFISCVLVMLGVGEQWEIWTLERDPLYLDQDRLLLRRPSQGPAVMFSPSPFNLFSLKYLTRGTMKCLICHVLLTIRRDFTLITLDEHATYPCKFWEHRHRDGRCSR